LPSKARQRSAVSVPLSSRVLSNFGSSFSDSRFFLIGVGLDGELAQEKRACSEAQTAANVRSGELTALQSATGLLIEELGAKTFAEFNAATVAGQIAILGDVPAVVKEAKAAEAARAILFGAEETLAIARSHYDTFALQEVSEGFARGYTPEQMDEIAELVKPFAERLAGHL